MSRLAPFYFFDTGSKFDQILAQAVIKKFLNKYIHSLSEGMIKEAYNLIESQTGSELRLSDFYTLIKDRDRLIIKEKKSSFKAVKVTKKMLVEGFQSNELHLSIAGKHSSELYLDADRIQFPLIIRRWEAGDRIQPFGMKGSQKISDHLTNRKVSAANKEKSLVLSDTDGTIYAIIFDRKQTKSGTISENCKVTDTTKQYLLITPKKQA
jgi:tRNA(Ile)-lysidine synthase